MPEIVLVCEGAVGGGEVRALQDLLTGARVNLEVVVRGCGGEAGLGAVADYISARERVPIVACVRDRDYRSLSEAEDSHTDGTREFIWRRHEFENYLVEPAVILAAMDQLREFAPLLPSDEADIREGLRSCAERRAAVEAVRMTLWAIRSQIDQEVGARLGFPSLHGTDGVPLGEHECAQAIRAECQRVLSEASSRAAHPSLQADAAESRYRETLASLNHDAYLDECLYLRDFAGRELLSSFWSSLTHAGVGRVTLYLVLWFACTRALMASSVRTTSPTLPTASVPSPDLGSCSPRTAGGTIARSAHFPLTLRHAAEAHATADVEGAMAPRSRPHNRAPPRSALCIPEGDTPNEGESSPRATAHLDTRRLRSRWRPRS